MSDMNVDATQAKQWNAEVDQEITEVKQLLKQVSASIEDLPEDDTIMRIIEETGRSLDESWTNLCDILESTISLLGSLFSNIGNTVENVKEDFQEFINNI